MYSIHNTHIFLDRTREAKKKIRQQKDNTRQRIIEYILDNKIKPFYA